MNRLTHRSNMEDTEDTYFGSPIPIFTCEMILDEIALNKSWGHDPSRWDKENINYNNAEKLVADGLIERLVVSHPEAMNAEYIYVEKGFKEDR
jgi:hypothetical protein